MSDIKKGGCTWIKRGAGPGSRNLYGIKVSALGEKLKMDNIVCKKKGTPVSAHLASICLNV